MVVLAVAIFLVKFLTGNSSGVPVPDVRPERYPAEQTLTRSRPEDRPADAQQSATVANGDVISTSPCFGSSEPKGSAINIVESSGPSTVALKNLIGLKVSDAEADLFSTVLLTPKIVQEQTPRPPPACSPPAGRASSTRCASGRQPWPPGPTVKLYVLAGRADHARRDRLQSAGRVEDAVQRPVLPLTVMTANC